MHFLSLSRATEITLSNTLPTWTRNQIEYFTHLVLGSWPCFWSYCPWLPRRRDGPWCRCTRGPAGARAFRRAASTEWTMHCHSATSWTNPASSHLPVTETDSKLSRARMLTDAGGYSVNTVSWESRRHGYHQVAQRTWKHFVALCFYFAAFETGAK